jgi:F-type H+-transporting ATPase subunit a
VLWKLPNIQVAADPLYPGAPAFLTNTFFLTIVSALIVAAFFVIAAYKPKIVPGFLQNFVEWVFEQLLHLCEEVAGKQNGRRFFPWVASMFLLILIANWWEVIPGIESIGLKTTSEEVSAACAHVGSYGYFLTGDVSNCIIPFLRPPSTDLNFTIALSIVSVVMTQIYGFAVLGWRLQISRYIVFSEGPIGFVVGLLEIPLELLRILSLSFRLFGNLFAGDVLLLVMSFISVGIGAIPFYFLEVFVGFIQAFVFAFLTLIFMTLGTTAHGHADAEEEHSAEAAHEERVRAEHAFDRAAGGGASEPAA